MDKAAAPPRLPDAPDAHSVAADQQAFAEQVLAAEAAAVARIVIGPGFHQAVELVLKSAGSVVVTGLGKSGLVGRKISATFASTGTASHFLHPTEAMHGDLGRVRKQDVVLALSYRGNTEEVTSLAAILKQDGVPVIALTATGDCDLARLATVNIQVGDVTEACPMNLAPTASTTATLALGDALALTVSRRRGFGIDDYHRFHPGGSLGRLLMPVTEAMRFHVGRTMTVVDQDMTVAAAYRAAAAVATNQNLRQPGALLVVDADGRLAGIMTDGDLRRLALQADGDFRARRLAEVMTRRPTRLPDTALIRQAVQLVRERRFDEIPVVDGDDRPVGLIDVQDLVALKVIEG
jgi:arabinose-5-phosphate isomerase